MAYSHFTFDKIKNDLHLIIKEQAGLFNNVTAAKTDEHFLHSLLEDNIPLGLAINTEKARSELIITPMLLELTQYTTIFNQLILKINFSIQKYTATLEMLQQHKYNTLFT